MKAKFINDRYKDVMTKDKVYDIVGEEGSRYILLNDNGIINKFPSDMFEVIEEDKPKKKSRKKKEDVIEVEVEQGDSNENEPIYGEME